LQRGFVFQCRAAQLESQFSLQPFLFVKPHTLSSCSELLPRSPFKQIVHAGDKHQSSPIFRKAKSEIAEVGMK